MEKNSQIEKANVQVQKATPATLLELAVANGADIEKLKELMDLQERWEKKEARKSFFDALSRFQTIVPELKKKKTASINSAKGHFSYKYADLGSIVQSIKSALNECGLSYRWEFSDNQNKLRVTCLLSHRDGHTETSVMEAGMDTSGFKNDIQQKGSTQTYLQRYTLIGALGLSTADEDNDGRGSRRTEKPEPSEEEVFDQWRQSVASVRSQIELTNLFLKNRKTVEGSPKIQAIFKAREKELKSKPVEKVEMP